MSFICYLVAYFAVDVRGPHALKTLDITHVSKYPNAECTQACTEYVNGLCSRQDILLTNGPETTLNAYFGVEKF